MRIISLALVCLVHGGAIAAIVHAGQPPQVRPATLLMQASLLQGSSATPEPEVKAKPLPQKKVAREKPKQTMLASQPAPVSNEDASAVPSDNTVPPEGEDSDQDAGSIDRPLEANYRYNPAPSYPMISRRLQEQGRVLLKVRVAEDGRALEVQLHTSSGFDRLDQVALKAVQTWQFEPAQRDGKAVTSWVLVPILFSLRG